MNLDGILPRLATNLRRKIVLGVLLTVGIWTAYLVLQRYPLFPVTAMEAGWVDRIVPFMPGGVYVYESLWLMMPVAPWLMTSRQELDRYTAALVSIALTAFLIFLFHPTAISRPKDPQNVNALYGLLMRTDNELNAFPSLHSAFAVFHAACCHAVFSTEPRHKGIRRFFWAWAFAIVASTLLTKQHVFADAVAGAALGIGFYLAICHRKTVSVTIND
jgi:membrane-associated phospholipid phosphatase